MFLKEANETVSEEIFPDDNKDPVADVWTSEEKTLSRTVIEGFEM